MHPGKYVLAALACAAIGGACAPRRNYTAQGSTMAVGEYERPVVHVRYVERAWQDGRQVSVVTHDRPAMRVVYIERVAGAERGGGPVSSSAPAPWSGPENPDRAAQAKFVSDQQQQMATIGARVHAYSREGLLPRGSLERFAHERDYVNGLLSQYTSDGRLTRDERRHIETAVLQMRDLEGPALATLAARERVTSTTARGGGPRPTSRHTR